MPRQIRADSILRVSDDIRPEFDEEQAARRREAGQVERGRVEDDVKKLHFSIDINSPRQAVWNMLWNDATFRDWTSVFAEGSYAVSDWNEGSKIQFIDPKGNNGMSAVIEKKRPAEFMSFRHLAEIKNGQEQPPASWSGAHEDYTLRDNRGGTTLSVDLDAADEFQKMFEDKFPQALQRVKMLAESSARP